MCSTHPILIPIIRFSCPQFRDICPFSISHMIRQFGGGGQRGPLALSEESPTGMPVTAHACRQTLFSLPFPSLLLRYVRMQIFVRPVKSEESGESVGVRILAGSFLAMPQTAKILSPEHSTIATKAFSFSFLCVKALIYF